MTRLLLLGIGALGCFSAQLAAQEVKRGSWAAVMRLNSGDYVRILTADRAVVTGRIDSVSEETIGLQRRKDVVSIARKEIVQVVMRTGKSRLKNIARSSAVGAGVGGGLFLGIGLAARESGEYRNMIAAGAAMCGAVIGAAAGALTPDEATVYQVKVK